MTYPLIGNYGVNEQDVESYQTHASGFVVRELSPVVSNYRADYSLGEYMERNGIPGIQGIDTRALTKKLRVQGTMNGYLTTKRAPRSMTHWPRQSSPAWSGWITSGSHPQIEFLG